MRRARDDQACLRVAAERLREHACQPGLAIGDVLRAPVSQCLDDLSERRQRLVDALGFVKGLALSPSLGYPLRTGQIY